MATATSNTFAVLISQATAAIWSKDNVLGNYDQVNDVWTPGRGSDGRVTQASWGQVPLNRWVKVAGTRMDQLDAVVKAALPGWKDWGSGGWNGVLQAWSGMAVDPSQPRAFFFGGGHFDSSNNGLYRFDFNKMAWAVQILPTDLTGADPRYTKSNPSSGSFSGYPASIDYAAANPNQNAVWGDDLYPFAPNMPAARHSYSSLAYDPVGNRVFMGCRRMWIADLNTGTWSVRFPFGTNAGAYNAATGYAGENMMGWWDEVRGTYTMANTQNYNDSRAWEYNPTTQQFAWTDAGGYPGGYDGYFAAAHRFQRLVWVFLRPDASSSMTARLKVVDLNSRTSQTFALTGDVQPNLFKADSDSAAVTYVPEKNMLLAMTFYSATGGGAWVYQPFWIDPVARTMTKATIPGNWFAAATTAESKLQYIPQLGAVVHIDSATDDIRVMRVI